jgi:hypothetical protein
LTHPSAARLAFDQPATILAVAVAAALSAACGSRVSDQPAIPIANECGGGEHISSVLGGFYGPATGWETPANINSTNCKYPMPLPVSATCLTVTAVDRRDETGDGAVGTVYLQDRTSPIPVYAALSLFNPSFTPPNLRVLPGDVLDVTGTYEEFMGPSSGVFQQCQTLPQIAGAAVFRYDGTVPDPVPITPGDLNSYDNARKYLSMLVTVNNVTIAADGAVKSGRYAADVSVPSGSVWAISDELFDVGGQMPLHMGDTFASITGIVTFFYSFHLAPRSAADFKKLGGAPPPADAGDGG